MKPQIHIEQEENLSPSAFLNLMELTDGTIINGCLGDLFISENTIAFRNNDSEWDVFVGKIEDLSREEIKEIEAIDLLDGLIDTTHNIECKDVVVSIIPNMNGEELTIIVGKEEGNPFWVHTDNDILKVLDSIKTQTSQ